MSRANPAAARSRASSFRGRRNVASSGRAPTRGGAPFPARPGRAACLRRRLARCELRRMRAAITLLLGSAALASLLPPPAPARGGGGVPRRARRRGPAADRRRGARDALPAAQRGPPEEPRSRRRVRRGRVPRRRGARSAEQAYPALRATYRNVLARFGPDTPERIVLGAHYDAAGDDPGADDDASGVAGLIEIARMLAASPPPIRVELAAYTLEEPPGFATEAMGSVVHARSLKEADVRVRLMMSLEMIGTFSDAPGSQAGPGRDSPGARTRRPATSSRSSGGAATLAWCRRSRRRCAYASSVPVETLVAPRDTSRRGPRRSPELLGSRLPGGDGDGHRVLPEPALSHARGHAGHARLPPHGGGGRGRALRRAGGGETLSAGAHRTAAATPSPPRASPAAPP